MYLRHTLLYILFYVHDFLTDMIFDRIQTTLEKDTLQDLAKTLPTYLLQARATNTTKSYKNGYQKWRTWAANYELQEMPANPISLALFLLSLIQSNHSVSSVENSYYGIKYYHKTLLRLLEMTWKL